MSLRYYLYVSDSKVDMLLAQIDPALRQKRTTEVNVSLKVVGGKRVVEDTGEEERGARLERLVRFLGDQEELGTVDDPRRFFRGMLRLRWGPFPADPSLVWFGGSSVRTVVGLGGSAHHVLGSPPPSEPVLPRSLTPSLLAGLASDPQIQALVGMIAAEEERPVRTGTPAAAQAVHRANELMPGPGQRVEFVAKRLLHVPGAPDAGPAVLLGTPLYVALVD
ncbi:DUF7019 family protein [Streptomyces sp. NPDC093094]|uniref:DUF7019 family protein n=1 Tax=Streptomyces sp. NPDC093094 TaxID=3366026 RepID=UPI0037F41BEF